MVFGAIAVAALVAIGLTSRQAAQSASPSADRAGYAADFTLKTVDGQELRLSDLRGKVVLLNFWATWCLACKEEMPLLESVYQQEQSAGLVVLGVDLQEDSATVSKFMTDNGLTFPVVLDTSGQVSSQYNVYYIPHTVIIDTSGKVARVHVGAFTSKDEILNDVTPLLH